MTPRGRDQPLKRRERESQAEVERGVGGDS